MPTGINSYYVSNLNFYTEFQTVFSPYILLQHALLKIKNTKILDSAMSSTGLFMHCS
jgi:hypothetical protein